MALDLSHVLIGAPYDIPLRVRRIVFDRMRAQCAELGVFEGSSVRRIGGTTDRMLIEVPKSGRVWLDRPVCTCIEVEPISRRSDSSPP